MHTPQRIIAPSCLPVSLDEAKDHLNVGPDDGGEWSHMIEGLIEAAVSYLDGYSGVLGRALVNQTWRQDFDRLDDCLRLPIPANAITSLVLLDSAGAETVVAASNYRLQHNGLGSFVRLNSGYTSPVTLAETAGVQVTFVAGYGADGAAVPAAIRHWILAMVAHWFANREAVGEGLAPLPGVDMLIAPFRRVGV